MGGYELLCQEHVSWLCGHGCDVVVLTTTFGTAPERPPNELGGAGERVVRALDFDWENFALRTPRGPGLWRRERRQRILLEQLVAEHRPDVALVWGMARVSKSLLAVLHQLEVPTVAVIGEQWLGAELDIDPWLSPWLPSWLRPWRVLRRPLVGVASRLVAPTDIHDALTALTPVYASAHIGHSLEAARPELRNRGRVVPNGIRLDLFLRERDLSEPLRTTVRMLYAGRVEPRKGVHTAVASLADLKRLGLEANLTIAGWRDPIYADDLRRQATQLGVSEQIEWTEAVPRDQVGDLLAAHDILVFPTLWDEPFGLVAVEAMAAGCIVVATGTGGSGEYLLNRSTAMLFKPGYSLGLAECILDLVEDPNLVTQLRRAGYQTASEHSFQEYATRLGAVISQVLADRSQ